MTDTTELRRVPLSVFDILPVSVTSTATDTLATTRAIARRVEELGFTRYWIAEHHNTPTVASASPPMVLAALGAATSRLRIGSGAVMLPNHSPYLVAEQFGTLNALYPDRVDIGVGSSTMQDPRLLAAIHAGSTAEPRSFESLHDELVGFLEGGPAASLAEPEPVRAYPYYTATPPVWVHASTLTAAEFAAERGVPLSFLHYFKPNLTEKALLAYREKFRPSAFAARPYAMIVTGVVCAADDERAQWLSGPGALAFVRAMTGAPVEPLVTPEQAHAHDWSGQSKELRATYLSNQAVGGPDTVRACLASLLGRTQADELMILTLVADSAARAESMTRVRELFGADLPLAPGR